MSYCVVLCVLLCFEFSFLCLVVLCCVVLCCVVLSCLVLSFLCGLIVSCCWCIHNGVSFVFGIDDTLSSDNDATALSPNQNVSPSPHAEKGSNTARFELESPHASPPKRYRKCRACLWAGCALMCFSDRLLVRWSCRSFTILLAGAKTWRGGVLILF